MNVMPGVSTVTNHNMVQSPISTGDCAAAAAKAAAANLLFRIDTESVTVTHERGSRNISVFRNDMNCNDDSSEYYAIMEGGIAPDIRDRARIVVNVSRIKDLRKLNEKAHIDIRYNNLFMQGGEGIGTAMSPLPDIKSGDYLIEKNPRMLIFDAVAGVVDISDGAQILMITISCPEGMMIAAKQPMVQSGFSGGITIIGDYGQVSTIHQRDITESIDAQIGKQIGFGVKSILVSPGSYCADKISSQLHVNLDTAIRCYNFPGYTIDKAVESGVENMLLVGNVGKLVKLAAGIMNTSSYASDGRREIFAAHTALVGGTAIQVRTVMGCITCDEILALLDSWGLRDRVMNSIMMAIANCVRMRCQGKLRFGVALFSEEYGLLGQTMDTKNVLVKVSQEQFALSLKLK
ncbi:cobalt-precorrin-5B (C(1))-methyltransferase [Butyrivibrio sp. DSM 10294]|uniref:cobalt-precorrin-5B (C(1))-methyltransferase n=1 Tax=Butyrivibrio sp. DSM 10294 TaxID=2972457 RepID=UPI00234E8BB6|nr:cobalt-precorrin-5B (C(1))-methyltransferase [Butyrivibrio sp. DSM 10294]MDC7295438.1 cobalt-precorrin-5B (C(1))-methyltransferase [Butyrivibrio sp. DSM 10294]